MNPSPPSEDVTADSATKTDPSQDELGAIRDLLFGQEKRRLDGLQERIEDPGLHAHDVSRVLPQAVTLASAKDNKLAVALTPSVESALKESVKRDPSTLVNAIFPIIGPAIRKSIAETFGKLVQSLNQTLDHSFSPRGLKWRLEAARTGKSFAEVVLAHTLVYRVEQVLLIHKRTGLLLLHITAPDVQAQDAGMVSGMLTAIQDFAHDSFRMAAGEALQTMQVGELNVWMESSPLVTLAAVIRGQAPREFRETLQGALESIHAEQRADLESFDGDASPFELARLHLDPCLRTQFAGTSKTKAFPVIPSLALATLLLLATWIGFTMLERQRWAGFVERLGAEPGIVITESGKRSGKFFVAGLRDPLAIEPTTLLSEFKLKRENIATRWEPYQALGPELVLRRALMILQPPTNVRLQVQDGTLRAGGHARGDWIEGARTKAAMLPGIQSYDDSGVADETQALIIARVRQVEQSALYFIKGLRLETGQEATLENLATGLIELRQLHIHRGRSLHVSLIGHTDATGTDEQNLRLSRARAGHVANLLEIRGVPADLLEPAGIGAREPLTTELPEQDHLKNRRVTFRVKREQIPAP